MLSYDFYHYHKLLFIEELLPLCSQDNAFKKNRENDSFLY